MSRRWWPGVATVMVLMSAGAGWSARAGQGFGGRRPVPLPELMHVAQTKTLVSFEDTTGHVIREITTLCAEADTFAHAPGALRPTGVWTGDRLVVQRTGGGDRALTETITLGEAVALAQRNAPVVIQAHGQSRTTAAGVRSAYAAFLPGVSLSAGATRQLPSAGARTRVENGQVITLPAEPWSYSLGLGANVTLFEGGRRFFDLGQARARASSAAVGEISARYDATLAVKQQFFNVLAARETGAAARAQLEQAEQQLRFAIVRLHARSTTRSDSLRSEIQLRNARLAVSDARTSLEVAAASLTRAVGTPYPVTAAGGDSLEGGAELALGDEAIRALAEDGPAVRQARAALDAARAARRAAWTAYLPSVTASYSRSGSGSGSTFGPGGTDYAYSGALRLSLSFPLFNQLDREGQVTQATVTETNAEAALRDARLAATESFAQAFGAFRSAAERVVSQTATVEAAQEDLRVQQLRYVSGGSTLLDVLTSQTLLDQGRRDLIRARYDLRVARAQLEALVGRDL